MVSTSCKGGRDSHGTVGSKGMKGASRIWVCVCVCVLYGSGSEGPGPAYCMPVHSSFYLGGKGGVACMVQLLKN